MSNHPHDCPVCDEGGECQLQEMTIAGGHSLRRYDGPKRTYLNQDLGPFVSQEMNRCIQCYRCVRTYQEYCGGDDYGVLGSRNRLFYGRITSYNVCYTKLLRTGHEENERCDALARAEIERARGY